MRDQSTCLGFARRAVSRCIDSVVGVSLGLPALAMMRARAMPTTVAVLEWPEMHACLAVQFSIRGDRADDVTVRLPFASRATSGTIWP